MTRRDRMPGEKSELHQPPRVLLGEIQTVQNPRLPMFQFHEVGGFRVMFRVSNLFDSRLHLEPSIYLECSKVKLLEYQDFDSQLQLDP